MRKSVLAAMTALGAGVAVLLGTGPTAAQPPTDPRWQQVGNDIKSGVSGLAVTSDSGDRLRTLVVRDNKHPGENRLAEVAYRPGAAAEVTPVAWQGAAEPVDLEALDRVPGTSDEYVAVASRGLIYHLKGHATEKAVRVLDISPLPGIGEGDDFESFSLTSRNGKLAALWADRGAGKKRPATVYSAPFSFGSRGESEFGKVKKAAFRAPYPSGDVRHVSDIDVTKSGRVFVSSASDSGDDGPFDSAVSDAGKLSVSGKGAVRLSLAKSPKLLEKFKGHKIEALHCVPGTHRAALGTDDENAGGSVTTSRLCD
ncbi:hypothetical protein GCM10010277_23150 [Streptomyces longisporoflavus]|uniref:hypothetical protein n=1 Tax=Streptomyces longisporoflavus TaxID=28044 RepID=UPI00167D1E0F|nr:hypothetical protein [Streptomyces longisporoflavus]GGV36588.1 hypothetical protein GCM10010277_23150 [Streptomyces longisporoflavus]